MYCILAYLANKFTFKAYAIQREADEKKVKTLQQLSSQQSSETESDRLRPGFKAGPTPEQKIDKENYREIWDKISSDLDDIIRKTNKCDR